MKKQHDTLLWDSIIEANYELDGFYREKPARPKPCGKPASEAELKRSPSTRNWQKQGF